MRNAEIVSLDYKEIAAGVVEVLSAGAGNSSQKDREVFIELLYNIGLLKNQEPEILKLVKTLTDIMGVNHKRCAILKPL